MEIRRVVPNIVSDHFDESRKFYTDFLGFQVAMNMDWILTLVSPTNPTAQLSLLRNTATTPHLPMTLSIEVVDVEAIYAKASALGLPIVYPLTTEPWGVCRFHVTDPNGIVINIMSHQK
jgi:catechol 2,3-dioxygenase-like lactoylglutathione lyase family enzyme